MWSGVQQPRAAIFDVFGVFTRSPAVVWAEYERNFNLPRKAILSGLTSSANKSNYELLERGRLTVSQFVEKFVPPDNSEPWKRFLASGSLAAALNLNEQPWPALLDAVCRLRAHNVGCALLTNNWYIAPEESVMPVPQAANLFDVVMESCKVNMRKPHRNIFMHTLRRLNVFPCDAIFLDDLDRNVNVGRDMGMRTIKVANQQAALSQLMAHFPYIFPMFGSVPRPLGLHNHPGASRFPHSSSFAFLSCFVVTDADSPSMSTGVVMPRGTNYGQPPWLLQRPYPYYNAPDHNAYHLD